MSRTRIEWAHTVWNPITGCESVSEGCRNCYARRFAKRLAGRGGYPAPPDDPFGLTIHWDRLEDPLRWRKPRRIFVCSMGDLFHEEVPFDVIHQVWNTMKRCPQHTFMILTKRPKRMHKIVERIYGMERLGWAKGFWLNVWLGVSVEDQPSADERILWLLRTWAAVRFVSCEPLLGPVRLRALRDGSWYDSEGATHYDSLTGTAWWGSSGDYGLGGGPRLDWVIVGGETGPSARPMHPDWVRSLRDECQETGVAFFFKTWGDWAPYREQLPDETSTPRHEWEAARKYALLGRDGGVSFSENAPATCFLDGNRWVAAMARVGKRHAGRLLDGREWNEWPEAAA